MCVDICLRKRRGGYHGAEKKDNVTSVSDVFQRVVQQFMLHRRSTIKIPVRIFVIFYKWPGNGLKMSENSGCRTCMISADKPGAGAKVRVININEDVRYPYWVQND